jgi:hypothetical protein
MNENGQWNAWIPNAMGEYENVQGNKGEVLEQAPAHVAQKEIQAVDVLFDMFPHKAAKTGLDKTHLVYSYIWTLAEDGGERWESKG